MVSGPSGRIMVRPTWPDAAWTRPPVPNTLSEALPPIDPPPPTTWRPSGQFASTDQPEYDCDGEVATTVCSPGIAAAGPAVITCTTADPRIAQAAAASKVSRRRPAMIVC